MNIKYTPAIPGIDWNDMQALHILSDAEEERGELLIANFLRWVVFHQKRPVPYRALDESMTPSLYPATWYHESTKGVESYSKIPAILLYYIEDDIYAVFYIHTGDKRKAREMSASRDYRRFTSVEDAYLALVNGYIAAVREGAIFPSPPQNYKRSIIDE